jgi:hypothetical protein
VPRASYAVVFPAASINAVFSGSEAVVAALLAAPVAPFVGHHEGDGSMALRSMTVHRYEEIRRRLAEGRSLREIARALGCSRRTVREVRDGERVSPDAPKSSADPLWMAQLDWPAIIHDLGLGHPLKFLWEEKAQHLITYPNFWKQFYPGLSQRCSAGHV